MITSINEILTEWAYRTKDGLPNPKSMAHQILLEGILKNYGWSVEARAELLNNLVEKTLVKNKESGAVYLVKNVNDEKHDVIKKDASEKDLDKAKGDKEPDGEEGIEVPEEKRKKAVEEYGEDTMDNVILSNEKKDFYAKGKNAFLKANPTASKEDLLEEVVKLDAEWKKRLLNKADKYRGEFDTWLATSANKKESLDKLFDQFLNVGNRQPDTEHPSATGLSVNKRTARKAEEWEKHIRNAVGTVNDELDKMATGEMGPDGKPLPDGVQPTPSPDHEKVKEYFNRVLGGGILSDKESSSGEGNLSEQEFFDQYVQIVEPAESADQAVKFYVAQKPYQWHRQRHPVSSRIYVNKKGSGHHNSELFSKWLKSRGFKEQATSVFGGKKTSPAKVYPNHLGDKRGGRSAPKSAQGVEGTLPKGEVSEVIKDGGGNVTGVRIGKLKMKRVSDADLSKLKDNKLERALINNQNIKEISDCLEDTPPCKFLDLDDGLVGDTPENRTIIIQQAITKMADKFKELADSGGFLKEDSDYPCSDYPPNGPKEWSSIPEDRQKEIKYKCGAIGIIKEMERLGQADPNADPEKWKVDFMAVMSQVANHNRKESGTLVDKDMPSLSEGWANFAEIYDAVLNMQGHGEGPAKGSAAILPSASNWKTTDVLFMRETGETDQRVLSPTTNIEQVIVTVDGRSVKSGVGGPSALTAKVEKSFANATSTLSGDEVIQKIIEMSEMHDNIYSLSLAQPSSSHQALQAKNKKNIEASASAAGVSDEFIKDVNEDLQPGGEAVTKIDSAVKAILKNRKDQKIPNPEDTEEKIRLRLEEYYRECMLSHRAYNKQLKSQGFGNDSFIAQQVGLAKNGTITKDSSDGVKILAFPECEFNIGFDTEGRSTNPHGGRFHNMSRKDYDSKWNRKFSTKRIKKLQAQLKKAKTEQERDAITTDIARHNAIVVANPKK